jgi:hypothetical protein
MPRATSGGGGASSGEGQRDSHHLRLEEGVAPMMGPSGSSPTHNVDPVLDRERRGGYRY